MDNTITSSDIISNAVTLPLTYSNFISDRNVNVFNIEDSLQELKNRIKYLETAPPLLQKVNCPNCGGTTELDIHNHILKCKYCKSIVFVGTKCINEKGI